MSTFVKLNGVRIDNLANFYNLCLLIGEEHAGHIIVTAAIRLAAILFIFVLLSDWGKIMYVNPFYIIT